MKKLIIPFVIFAFGLFLFIYGTLFPLIKNKKCTETLHATIVWKKDKGFSADDGTSFNYVIAKVRYSYHGKTYSKRINIGLESYRSFIPLRINPSNPKMCLLNNRKLTISHAVINFITSAILIALSVFWVIYVV